MGIAGKYIFAVRGLREMAFQSSVGYKKEQYKKREENADLYMAARPHNATKNHFSLAVKTLYGLSWEFTAGGPATDASRPTGDFSS